MNPRWVQAGKRLATGVAALGKIKMGIGLTPRKIAQRRLMICVGGGGRPRCPQCKPRRPGGALRCGLCGCKVKHLVQAAYKRCGLGMW